MWKRVSIMIIALVATFGVVLKLNQNIMALSPYKSGGAVTGRVIMAPTDVANEEHALKKGDRIATDVINWQLIENTTYTDYGCNNAFSSCPAMPAKNAWLSFTTTSYKKIRFVPNNNVYTAIVDASDDGSLKFSHPDIGVKAVNFSSTNLYNATLQLDAAMKSSNQVSKIIAARDLTKIHQAIQDVQSYEGGTHIRTFAEYDSISRQNLFGANVIPFHFAEQVLTVPSTKTVERPTKDLAFTENYWTAMGWDYNSSDEGRMVVSNGMHDWKSPASSAELATRNAVYFDLSKVVFAVSQGTTNEISTVTKPNLPTAYTNITNDAIGSSMKLRILNTTMTAELHSIKKVNGQELYKEGEQYHIAENRTVLLDASANSFQGSTLSVILFDEANNFKYYSPLEAAKGDGTYTFSTKGIAPGNYKIAIVNEDYNDSILEPADSSLLSSTLSLKITNAVPMDYQENSESYEYTINVNVKENIGSLYFQNDILPQGISIKSSTTGGSEHANDYLNFDLTSTSIASIYDVSIKEKDAPDVRNGSLQAGDYYFRIEATDGNADIPVILFEEVKLTVNKTDSTLSFSSPDIKELKIGSAPLSNSVVTNNTDILISTDVNFTLNGGINGVLSVATDINNPLFYVLSSASSYNGLGLPASFTLSASIKETKNFKASLTSTNTPIYVYKELGNLIWSPSKSSFLTSEVEANANIGTLYATDGTAPYKYELVKPSDDNFDIAKGKDNAFFSVQDTAIDIGGKAQVKTIQALTANTYYLQFKVIDSKGNVNYTHTSIEVTLKTQTALEFKDKIGGSNITSTGLKMKFNAKDVSLIAEGGNTKNAIEYTLAPKDMQPGNIDAAEYAQIDKSSGLIHTLRTGTIKVQATRPKDLLYEDVIAYMDVTIEPAEQTLAFSNNTSNIYIKKGSTMRIDAKGAVKATNANGIGGITYKSDNESIATVDMDGNVSGLKAGTITLTATLNNSNLSENKDYNSNYDTVTAEKKITIYEGMNAIWTASSPQLKAESSDVDAVAGNITVSNNTGAIDFEISTSSSSENIDASYFKVIGSGTSAQLLLTKKITASEQASHSGKFCVKIEIKDTLGKTSIDIPVLVSDADNSINFTKDGEKITSLTKIFGEEENTFLLTSSSSNAGNATYQLDLDAAQDVLQISGTGVVKILKTGKTNAQVVIAQSAGYAGGNALLPITIEKGKQSVKFQDISTLNRKFIKDSTFTEKALLKETSKENTSSRKITYTSNSPTICSIDVIGTITMLEKGLCDVSAVNNDADWESTATNKKINLYEGMGGSFTQNNNLQADAVTTIANAIAGSFNVSGGSGTKTYEISSSTNDKNKDKDLFKINSGGLLLFSKSITASDLMKAYNPVNKMYELHVQINITDELKTTICIDTTVAIKGAALHAEFDTGGIGSIIEEYAPTKTFLLTLASNSGGGTPTYRLKDDPDMPKDVLQSVEASGLVHILHANDKKTNTNPVIVEAVIPASNGYDEEIIDVEIEITKASQPNFEFKTPTIKLGHGASTTPLFNGKLSSGSISLTSNNANIVSVDSSSIKAEDVDGKVIITALDSGDRDYKSASATANVEVSGKPAYSFAISVPVATYGDTNIKAKININEATGSNQIQTWTSSDTSIADIDVDGTITIHKAGSVLITCTQTSNGEPSVSANATLVVKPKPITVTIQNASKYVGASLPIFIADIPSLELIGSDTIGQPTFSCLDGDNVIDENSKAGTYIIQGSYPTTSYENYKIKVQNGTLTIKQDTSQASWFHLEGDTSKTPVESDKWHNQDIRVVLNKANESAGLYDELRLNDSPWDTNSILVPVEGIHDETIFFRIQNSHIQSTPQPTQIKIDKTSPEIMTITGTEVEQSSVSKLLNKLTFGIFFNPEDKIQIMAKDIIPSNTKSVSGIKDIKYEVFELDKVTGLPINLIPITKGSKAPDSSGLLQFQIPQSDTNFYRVCATSQDYADNISNTKCSDLFVKELNIDKDGDTIKDLVDSNKDGCPDLNIVLGKDELGRWMKVNTARENEMYPYLNIDSDGKDTATAQEDLNIDTDFDLLPDINLVVLTQKDWIPTQCVKNVSTEYCTGTQAIALLNIDVDGDYIPDINIDSNGDLKADVNITKENDIKPYINVMKLHTWTPDTEYQVDSFSYDSIKPQLHLLNEDSDKDGRPDLNLDTDEDGIADLNIDADHNGIPELDIDSNGDGKPDINIDVEHNGHATQNIILLPSWTPEKDVTGEKLEYDTMTIKGNDELENGGIVIKPSDPGTVFLPSFALKVNEITDSLTKADFDKILKDSNIQDKEVKKVFDVNLLENNKVVQPNGNIEIKIPVDSLIKNPRLLMKNKEGIWEFVEAEQTNGYFIITTNYINSISILGDTEAAQELPLPKEPDATLSDYPKSVQGNYTPHIGGAYTGDNVNALPFIGFIFITSLVLILCFKKIKNN